MIHTKLFRLALFCLALLMAFSPTASAGSISKQDKILQRAWQLHQTEFQVTFTGEVIVLLSDDTEGDRHQRFIVELESGQTLLVVHNIDIAPRVRKLRKGSIVTVRGEYIWNSQGGLVHFTHRALYEDIPGGWVKFKGVRYR
ncbi:MAG: DUF3465 domain-containing protein [Verrucomicrobiota bacterium]